MGNNSDIDILIERAVSATIRPDGEILLNFGNEPMTHPELKIKNNYMRGSEPLTRAEITAALRADDCNPFYHDPISGNDYFFGKNGCRVSILSLIHI